MPGSSAKIKIGIISTRNSDYWGGNEELWFQTALEAARYGHRVIVSVCDFINNEERLTQLEEAGVRIFLRKRRTRNWKTKLKAALKDKLNFPFPDSDPYGPLFQQQPDVLLIGQAGTFDFFNNLPIQRFVKKNPLPVVVNSQYLAEHVVLPKAEIQRVQLMTDSISLFAFVSERNRITFERMTCQKLKNVMIVQNPVKTRKIEFLPMPANEILEMAMVGRLVCSDKGQDMILQVLATAKWRNRNWHLNIYGRGPDEFYLKELVKHYELTEKVVFHGFETDIRKMWLKNHVLILPSFAEGSPLALLEAVCCGRPAVATDVGGNNCFIEEDQTGFLASAPTEKSLDDSLEKLWKNKNYLEQMGRNAVELAKQKVNLHPEQDLLSGIVEAALRKNQLH